MKPKNISYQTTVHRLAVVVAASLMIGGGAAPAADLKTIEDEETYQYQGQSVRLRQSSGEIMVQLHAAEADSTTEIQTESTGSFALSRKLSKHCAMFVSATPGTAARSGQVAADALNGDARVAYAYPVFVSPDSGKRVFLNDEIVVCFKESATEPWKTIDDTLGLRLTETLPGADRLCVFRLTDPKNANPFKVCQALLSNEQVAWAEPNFTQEGQALAYPPNDPLLSSLWHLRNTGQQAASGADVKAYDAWVGEKYGSPGIRIAILDSGVETGHPDLAANIVAGYDFKDGDADPSPTTSYDNHGTPVAGVAAAVVDNGIGVAGVAGKCKILPVRIARTVDANGTLEFASNTELYRAFVYAADNADVLNCSWKLATFSSAISTGISYAYTYGRAGKGCAVMVAAGGDASGHGPFSWEGDVIPLNIHAISGPGNFRVEFSYEKDATTSQGDDAVWLAEIYVPLSGGYAVYTFDGGTFAGSGWTPGGTAGFTLSQSDPAYIHGTSKYALKSGNITHNQNSRLESPLLTISDPGQRYIYFRRWMSSEQNDVLRVYIKDQNGNILPTGYQFSGGQVSGRNTGVAWPASLSTVFAVGASTDFDYRAGYSPFGSALDFLAPAAGGFASQNSFFWLIDGILTTDRRGAAGYVAADYTTIWGETSGAGGTSMSSAAAAGVAALVLSKNGNQTRATLANTLVQYCDQVGPVPYSGSPSRNDYYGHGRLNAYASVNATTADTTAPTYTSAKVMHYRAVDVAFSEPMGEGVLTPGNYTITAGRGTLAWNPAKVIRITPTAYRLIWTAGDMTTSGTVTIAASSSIKDVAGNLLTGLLSRSSTGNKRIIAINGGSPYGPQGLGTHYAPPFVSDNGFQGNEPHPLLSLTSGMNAQHRLDIRVDLSGVVNPAPEAVYQTSRVIYYDYYDQVISYAIPVESGSYTLRLHFCQNYFNNIGDEVFDIYVNGSAQWYMFDILAQTGGQMHKAYIAERNNVSPVNGTITVTLDPRTGNYGDNASICGIEIVKP